MKTVQLLQVLCLGLLLEAFLQGKELIHRWLFHTPGRYSCISLAQVHFDYITVQSTSVF